MRYNYLIKYKNKVIAYCRTYESAKYIYEKFCNNLDTFEMEYVDIVEVKQ